MKRNNFFSIEVILLMKETSLRPAAVFDQVVQYYTRWPLLARTSLPSIRSIAFKGFCLPDLGSMLEKSVL